MLDGFDLSWTWSPGVFLFLAICSAFYIILLLSAKRRQQHIPYRYICRFFLALLLLGIFLISPINAIAQRQLFFVHVIQFVLVTNLCAPLLLWGLPASLLQPVLTNLVVRTLFAFFTQPIIASILFNASFLIWHVPAIFELVSANNTLYSVMMLQLFFVSLLPWWPLIGSVKELRPIRSYPLRMAYVFLDGQPIDVYALVMLMSGWIFYTHYVPPVGLSLAPLADQITAAIFLLIPGIVDLIAMSPLFMRWLRQIEERTRIEDQRRQAEMEMEEKDEEDDDLLVSSQHVRS